MICLPLTISIQSMLKMVQEQHHFLANKESFQKGRITLESVLHSMDCKSKLDTMLLSILIENR